MNMYYLRILHVEIQERPNETQLAVWLTSSDLNHFCFIARAAAAMFDVSGVRMQHATGSVPPSL